MRKAVPLIIILILSILLVSGCIDISKPFVDLYNNVCNSTGKHWPC